jgi:hypothetical protein
MLVVSLLRLRASVGRQTALPSLRRRLQRLRHTNRVAEDQLRERRRLHKLLRDTKHNTHTYGSSSSDEATARAIHLLPRNDALEAAMALSISENRDARTELELVRQLINSTLLSLASPVDPKWDPYDVKPQVFALNTYIALPVFTSIHYLRLFCQRFGFVVRDPSGVLWAAGAASSTGDDSVRIAGLLPDGVVQSEWWHHRHVAKQMHMAEVQTAEKDSVDADACNTYFGVHKTRSRSAITVRDAAVRGGPSVCEPTVSPAAVQTTALTHSTQQILESSITPLAAMQDTPPLQDSTAPVMDATSLFDAMMMEGVGEASAATPAREGSPTPRVKKTREPALPSWSGTPPKGQRGNCRGGRVRRRRKRKLRFEKSRRAGRDGSTCVAASHAGPTEPDEAAQGQQQQQRRKREAVDDEEDAAKAAYWQTVARTAPFGLKQATPLPTFGPFVRPFLIGYFADISTLLHNAAIVPEKVDIVVNPGSPIEFVLARAATDRVLHKEQLLHLAYLKVEKELQREFSAFFARYCPEVLYAASACVPLPMNGAEVEAGRRAASSSSSSSISNPLQDYRERTRLLREAEYRNGVSYELTILIQSTSLEETFMKIQQAKHQSMLMGHSDLDVLPEAAAAPHVREMAQPFYDGASEQEKRITLQSIASHATGKDACATDEGSEGPDLGFCERTNSAAERGKARMGVFELRGAPHTINVAQSADSYYHDPTNAYTEAHAVFTEELKVKRGQ